MRVVVPINSSERRIHLKIEGMVVFITVIVGITVFKDARSLTELICQTLTSRMKKRTNVGKIEYFW